MTAHSKIGASSMKRWEVCPGSVRLCEGLEKTSDYAKEGTAAHALAEYCVSTAVSAVSMVGQSFQYDDHGETCVITVSDDMASAVAVYEQFIAENYEEGDVLLLEHKFHLKELHSELFGTSDAVIWKPAQAKLIVADYKHGAGQPVEVQDNPQLRYYAVGALLESKFPARVIETVIVQPRCEHPDGYVRGGCIDVIDLLDWMQDLIEAVERVEAARLAAVHLPPGEWAATWLTPGPHCRETFCAAQATCPALAAKTQALAKQEFGPLLSYDPQQLAETLRWLPVLEGWVKAVREFAYGEAEHGRAPPGWKLVEKRATRKWKDEAAVTAWLAKDLKLLPDEMYEQKIKSVAAIEKITGKGGIPAEYVSKESSGFTLAPEEDRREAIKNSAQADFAN